MFYLEAQGIAKKIDEFRL